MSDPKIINIQPGEPEEIISERDAEQGIPYIIEVSGDNPVRYAHNKRYADQGATLSDGQSHTLSNFRGEPVYLAAFDGPTAVRAFPAGAEFKSQPEKSVTVEGDVSLGSDIAKSSDVQALILPPITDTTTGNGSSSAAQLQLGRRDAATVSYDLSATADLVIEGSADASNWYPITTINTSGTGSETVSIGFEYIRAYAASAVNEIAIGGK